MPLNRPVYVEEAHKVLCFSSSFIFLLLPADQTDSIAAASVIGVTCCATLPSPLEQRLVTFIRFLSRKIGKREKSEEEEDEGEALPFVLGDEQEEAMNRCVQPTPKHRRLISINRRVLMNKRRSVDNVRGWPFTQR